MTTLTLAILASQAAGTVSKNDVSMTVVDAVAVWRPSENLLTISLLPFKPGEKQIETLRTEERFSTAFAVGGQPSPDPAKWKTWCPWAELKITLKDGKVVRYHLVAKGLTDRSYTDNVNVASGDAAKAFPEFELKPDDKGGGAFKLRFADAWPAFSGEIRSDVRIQGTLLAPLPPK